MYRPSGQAHRAKKPPLPISELVKECDREQTKNTRVSRPFKQPRAALPAYPGEGILSSRQAPRSLSFGVDGGESSRFDGGDSLEESEADDGSCRAEKHQEERPQDREGERRRTPRSARARSLFGADELSEEDAPGEDEPCQHCLPRRSNEGEMVTQRLREGEGENKKRVGGKKGFGKTHSHSGRGRENREDSSEDGDTSPRLLGRHFSTFSSMPCTDTRKATSTVGTDPSSSSSSLSSAASFSSSSGSGTVTGCLAPSWLLSTLGVSPDPTAGSSSSSSSAASLSVPHVSSRTSGDRGPTTPSEQPERGEKRVSFSRGGSVNGRRDDSGGETVARGRARVKRSEGRREADPGERGEGVREQEREKRRAARDKSASRRRGRHERRSERKEDAGETTEEGSEGDTCSGGRRETKKRRFLDRSGDRDSPTSAVETEAEEKRVACRGQLPRRAPRSASRGREKKREGEKTRRTPDEREGARMDEEVADGGGTELENGSVSEFGKKQERRSGDREKTRQDRKVSRHGSKRNPSERKTGSAASFLSAAPSLHLYPPSTLFGSARHSSTLLPCHGGRPFGAPNFASSLVSGRSESLSASTGVLSRLPLEAALSSVSCGGDTRGRVEVANGDSKREERDASCEAHTLEREAADLSANKPRSPPPSLGALLQVSSRLAVHEGKKAEGSREEGSREREQATEASTDSVENAERSERRGAETEGEEAAPESKSGMDEGVEAGASDSFFGGEGEEDRDGDQTEEKKDSQDACVSGELWPETKRESNRTARRCSVGIQCESVDSARGEKETETPFPSLLQEEQSEREKERQQFLRFCQQLQPSASPSLLFNYVPSASTHSRATSFPVADARVSKEFSVEKDEEALSPSLPGSPRTLRDRPLRHFAPLAFNSSASHPRRLVCSGPLEMEASSPCSSSKHPCSSSSPCASSTSAASSSFLPLECVSSFGTAPGALFGEEEERVPACSFLAASEIVPSPSQPASLCAARSRQSVREKEDEKQELLLEAEREKAAALWRLEELKQLGRQVSLWGERRLLSGAFFGGVERRTELLHHLGVQLEEEGFSDPEEDDEEDFQESVQQQLLFFQRMQREQPSLFPHTLAKQRQEAKRTEAKGGEGQGEATSDSPSATLTPGGKRSGESRDLSGKEKEDDVCSVHSDSTVCLPPYFYVALSPAGGSPGKRSQAENPSRRRGEVDRGPVSFSSFDSKDALQEEEGEQHARGSGQKKHEGTREDTREGMQGQDQRGELSSEEAFFLQRRHEMHLWRRLLEGEEEGAEVSQAATCALLRRTRRARVSAPAGVAVECWHHRDLTVRGESEEEEEQREKSRESESRADAEMYRGREEVEEGHGEGSCEEEEDRNGQAETESGHARVGRDVDAVGDWNEEEREMGLEEAAALQAESLDMRSSLPVAESLPCIEHESDEETENRDRGVDDFLRGDDEDGGAARRWLSLSSGRDNTEPPKHRGECDGSDQERTPEQKEEVPRISHAEDAGHQVSPVDGGGADSEEASAQEQRGDDPPSFPLLEALATAASRDSLRAVGASFAGQEVSLHPQGHSDVQVHSRLDKVADFSSSASCCSPATPKGPLRSSVRQATPSGREREESAFVSGVATLEKEEEREVFRQLDGETPLKTRKVELEEEIQGDLCRGKSEEAGVVFSPGVSGSVGVSPLPEEKKDSARVFETFFELGGGPGREEQGRHEEEVEGSPPGPENISVRSSELTSDLFSSRSSSSLLSSSSLSVPASKCVSSLRVEVERAATETLLFACSGQKERGEEAREQREEEVERERDGKGERGADSSAAYSCRVHREEEGEGGNFRGDESLPDRNEGTDSRERHQREDTQSCRQSERSPGPPSQGRRLSDTEARRPEATLASSELDVAASGNNSQRQERQDEQANAKNPASVGRDGCVRGKSQEGKRTEVGVCGIQAANQAEDSEDRGTGNAQNFAFTFQIFSSPQRSCCSHSPLHAATPLPFDVETPTPLREVNEEREDEEREESAREEQEARATGEEKEGGGEGVGDSRRSTESESEETGDSNPREETTSCPVYTIQTSPDLRVAAKETDDPHLSSSSESPSRPEKGEPREDLVGGSPSLTEATEEFLGLVSSGFLPCSFQPPTPSPAFLAALQDSPSAAEGPSSARISSACPSSGAVSSPALPLPAPSPLFSPSCLHTRPLELLGRGTDEGRDDSGEENGGGNPAEIDAENDSEKNAENGGEGEKENRIEGVRSPRRSASEAGQRRGPIAGTAFGAAMNPGDCMQLQASSGGEAERREGRGRKSSQVTTRERRETVEGRSSAFRERGKNSSGGSDSESSREREKRWRTERDSTSSRAASADLHRKKEEQEVEREEKDDECVETDLMSPRRAAGALTVSSICVSLETRSLRQNDMPEGSTSRQRDEDGVSCDQDVCCLRESFGTDSTNPVSGSPASPFSIRSASAAHPSSDTSSSVPLSGLLFPSPSASLVGPYSSTSSESVPRAASAPVNCSRLSSSSPSCCRPSAASSSPCSSLSSPLHLSSGSARGIASEEPGCGTLGLPFLSSPAKKRKGSECTSFDSETAKPSFGLWPSAASRSPLCSARGQLERASGHANGEAASGSEEQALQSRLTPGLRVASSEAAPRSPREKREKETPTRALCEAPVLVLSDEEEESLGSHGVSPLHAPRPSEDMTGSTRAEVPAERQEGVRGEYAEETGGVEDLQGAMPKREGDREGRVGEREGDSAEKHSLDRDADERREHAAREESWRSLERNEPVEVEPPVGLEEDKRGVGTLFCEKKSAKSSAKAERWHLSKEDQKALAALLQRLGRPRASDGEVLLHRAGIPLTVKSLRGLLPGGLLDDEVINLYMVLLQERNDRSVRRSQSGASASPPLRCQFFPSHFYASLRKGGFDSVRRWTLRKKVDIFRQDVLIFPLHVVAETHWALGVVNFRDGTLEYYDSLDYQEEGREFGEKIKEYLRREHLDKKQLPFAAETRLKPLVKSVPCQENSSDCGVFCCQFAEHLGAARLAFDFTQADITSLRYKMMLQLCQTYVA
ncbi:UNVERIFIED_CONTAM: Ulp1 protease family, C-terminal catalytic domain-containing protein [Hammondia hammondi]|eukprot:XP_008887206.1 Ulp1 protease family, C-terminal catalytic domain-containing protein [Hammondia hammondi]